MSFMDQDKVKESTGVVKLLERRGRTLKGEDSWWHVEFGLLNMLSGSTAADRTKQVLLNMFPSQKYAVAEATVLTQIQGLIAAPSFKFLPVDQQSAVRFAATMVAAVDGEATKTLKMNAVSDTFVLLWQACVHFLKYQGQVDSDSEVKMLSGPDAIDAIMFAIQSKPTAKKSTGSGDVGVNLAEEFRLLRKYSFAACAATKPAMSKLLAGAGNGAAAAKGKAKAKPKPSARASAAKDKATADAAGLFA